MKFVFSPQAEHDLEEIGDYIARDNPSRAVQFIDDIHEHCLRIFEMPEAYPLRSDILPQVRMAVHGRYLILFTHTEQQVRIERVIHGSRSAV